MEQSAQHSSQGDRSGSSVQLKPLQEGYCLKGVQRFSAAGYSQAPDAHMGCEAAADGHVCAPTPAYTLPLPMQVEAQIEAVSSSIDEATKALPNLTKDQQTAQVNTRAR